VLCVSAVEEHVNRRDAEHAEVTQRNSKADGSVRSTC